MGLTGATTRAKQHACPRSCLSIPASGYYAVAGVFLRSAAPLQRSAGQGRRKKTANACGARSATREAGPAVAELRPVTAAQVIAHETADYGGVGPPRSGD